jgi:enoyl-CoA hydratase
MNESYILSEARGAVGWLTLNRPQALNALNDALIDQLGTALLAFDRDDLSFIDVFKDDYITRNWDVLRRVRKPLIAAVAGYALGGGCELAMMCDLIIAADSARFGQPEIKLGIIPGAGGTQRLPRAVGKAKAMDLVLTGRTMDAQEAERAGLVSRVVPAARLQEETMAVASTIAGYSHTAVKMAKECVNRAYESGLADGVLFERRLFHALFATGDQKEGMAAFLEKRPAKFDNT